MAPKSKKNTIPTSEEFMEIYNANKNNKQAVIKDIALLAIDAAQKCETTFNYTRFYIGFRSEIF